MFSVVVLVLSRAELLPDVLRAWEEAGVPGATILHSTGMGRVSRFFGRDDVPLFPSLRDLTEDREFTHHTIFSLVDDDRMVDKLIAATESVVGDLMMPDTGILFVLPVSRAVGYRHHAAR